MNKYKAQRTTVTAPNGKNITFASKKEAERYTELCLLQRAGKISNLRIQVPYVLIPPQTNAKNQREAACKYIADFVYERDGKEIVEDVKGYTDARSAAYKLFTVKRKLMLYVHGITITEV